MKYALYFLTILGTCAGFALIALPSDVAQSGSQWQKFAQRPDLLPRMATEGETFTCESNGHIRVNGGWQRSFPILDGKYYRVRAEYQAENVDLLRRSILVTIDWRDSRGQRISQPEYPATVRGSLTEDQQVLKGIYKAPAGSHSATVSLILRWDAAGKVTWRNVSFEQDEPPQPRNVKIATVHHRPRNSSGPAENLEQFGEWAERAGKQGADIVCLPEGITVVGTGSSYVDAAETIPGRTTRYLGEIAKKSGIYIAAGIYEKEGKTVYNTAVLLDRAGNLVGKYRKAALPREEIEGGITPGSDFPVFDTDFGRVGMMICWDVFFPEPARVLASRGADIILLPIWGGNETLIRARAIENQVYLVTSSYDARTGIYDREGNLLVEATEAGPLVMCEVDLGEQTLWKWLGDFRARIPREAPRVIGEK